MNSTKSDDNIKKNIKYLIKNENQIIQLGKKLSNSPFTKKINKNNLLYFKIEKQKILNNSFKSKKIKLLSLSPRTNSSNFNYKTLFNKRIEPKKQEEKKKVLVINDLIGGNEKIPIDIIFNRNLKNFIQGKNSKKSFGLIKAYSANTCHGIIRNYNEDRVSIIINMTNPNCDDNKKWPKISYFGIFDGHGGNKCAEYLRDNLLNLIIENKNFPSNINLSIREALKKADEEFLKNMAIKNGQIIDFSGSCALFLLLINNLAYIVNVGDSRCLISYNKGKIKRAVTRDHKPNYEYEKERIIKNGGIIYQSQNIVNFENKNISLEGKILVGPYRVIPGRLSVSRTFGDVEAKLKEFGGLPNVVISEPDIYTINVEKDNVDYFILGCDGIFDQLSNDDIFDCVYLVVNHNKNLLDKENKNINLHKTCGDIVNLILNASMERKSLDNITCIFVALKDLLNYNLNLNNINNYRNKDSIPYNKNDSYKISLSSSKSTKNTINISLDSKNIKNDRNFSLKTKMRVPSTKSSGKNRITIDYPNQVKKIIMQNSQKVSSHNIIYNPNKINIKKKIKESSSKKKFNHKNNGFLKDNSKKAITNTNIRTMNNSYSLKYYSFTDYQNKKNLISEKNKEIKPPDINNWENSIKSNKKISKSNPKAMALRNDENSVKKIKKKNLSVKSIFKRDKSKLISSNQKHFIKKISKKNNEKINIFNSEMNGNNPNKIQKNRFIEFKFDESPKNLFNKYYKFSLNNFRNNHCNNNDVKVTSLNLEFKNEFRKTNIKLTGNSSLNNGNFHSKKLNIYFKNIH